MFIKKSDGTVVCDAKVIVNIARDTLRAVRQDMIGDKVNYYGLLPNNNVWRHGVRYEMITKWYRDKNGRIMVYYN